MIFSKTIRDLKIPHMEVIDTYIRNLHDNICAFSFETVLAPGHFSCFYMFRENAYNFIRAHKCFFKFDIKQKGNIAVYTMIPVVRQ